MKLRPSIVLTYSNNFVYAMDVNIIDSKVFKFESVAAFFIKELNNQKSETEIIQACLKEFEGSTEDQIKYDFGQFIKSIDEFGFLQQESNK